MICDAHIHVGRYYRMTDAETFVRSDFYYEPKVVADVLKYSVCEALARECREELALEIVNACVRTAVTHACPDRTIHLTLIDCEPAPGAEPSALEHEVLGWYTPAEMSTLNFCPADAELLPLVFPLSAF